MAGYLVKQNRKVFLFLAHELVKLSNVLAYQSLSPSWHFTMSGVFMMPQCLNRPSPMERDTSNTPITLPSLKQ